MKFIPYGHQLIDQEDIDSVVSVLKSDWLTQGPIINTFEEKVAKYCGVKYALAVSNGTSALHLSCIALGLKKGDYFWTSPNSFVASANCGLYCGASVDFVDIDPHTFNIDVNKLEEKLKKAEKTGRLPKVLIPVHFGGQPCDLSEIRELSTQYGFKIIEDGAHAIGARYNDKKIGSSEFSEITVFSFHPVKIITTGEGGMVLTNNEDLYNKLINLRSHGITRDVTQMKGDSDGPWYYQQLELGYNYRITDIQAALGLSQINKIDDFVHRRNHLAEEYEKVFENLPIYSQAIKNNRKSSYHLYVVRLQSEKLKKDKLEIFQYLRKNNIGVNTHYIPIHLQPYFRDLGFSEGDFPESESYYKNAITLPMYPGIKDEEFEYITKTFREALG